MPVEGDTQGIINIERGLDTIKQGADTDFHVWILAKSIWTPFWGVKLETGVRYQMLSDP